MTIKLLDSTRKTLTLELLRLSLFLLSKDVHLSISVVSFQGSFFAFYGVFFQSWLQASHCISFCIQYILIVSIPPAMFIFSFPSTHSFLILPFFFIFFLIFLLSLFLLLSHILSFPIYPVLHSKSARLLRVFPSIQ